MTPTWQRRITYLLLLSTLSVYLIGVPIILMYLFAFATFIGVSLYGIRHIETLEIHTLAGVMVATIILIYLFQMAFAGQLDAIQRGPVFALSSLVIVFLLPAIVSQKQFLHCLGIIGLVVSVAALLTGPIPTFQWHPENNDFVIKFLFRNPNTLGIIAVAGAWGLIPAATRAQRPEVVAGGIGLCLLAAVLAENRAMLLGVVGAAVVVTAWYLGRAPAAIAAGVAGGVFTAWIFGVAFGVVPGPSALVGYDFNSRVYLWEATIDRVTTSPARLWFGYGPVNTAETLRPALSSGQVVRGPHNVYFRMLLTAGIVGLVAYVGFQLLVLDAIRTSISSVEDVVIMGLFVTVLIADLFGSASIFGFSADTLILGTTAGFALRWATGPTEQPVIPSAPALRHSTVFQWLSTPPSRGTVTLKLRSSLSARMVRHTEQLLRRAWPRSRLAALVSVFGELDREGHTIPEAIAEIFDPPSEE